MATKQNDKQVDNLTVAVKREDKSYKGPTVQIYLPKLEDSGDDGIKVDQYEHVTIANEESIQEYRVHRGEHVEVPVPVFITLKARYPEL
jgi:hypothetical protein